MDKFGKASPVSLKDVRITGSFWSSFMEKIRLNVIPYQWEALNDRIEGAEPSRCVHNFRVASGRETGEYGGFVFQESDMAKWIEAASHSLTWHPDAALERTLDAAIDDIVAAQQSDGYLNTYYIVNGLEKRFTNLKDNHELYCLGHFLEGAVAYYQATGKDRLLKALQKYVDLVDSLIGPEDGKLHGYPGHEEIELALIKLYRVTKNPKYLKLASYFVDERGREPLFFREESEKNGNEFYWQNSVFQFDYYQASRPVREQTQAVGHAVRAVYLYSGMADVARETGDEALLDVCRRLWQDITQRQMYITGGIGSSHYGEAFTYAYDLPNDTIYAETCASIGLVFFAWRMLNLEPRGEYGDVMEKALYNGILSGMSADGKSFFYVNPLEVNLEACENDQLHRHVKPERQKWFGCACCPPNLARLLSSLGGYAYSKRRNQLYVNLYAAGHAETTLDAGNLGFEVDTNYPWEETITLKITQAPAEEVTLSLRIPGWCQGYTLALGGGDVAYELRDGYASVSRVFASGDTLTLTLPMPVVKMEANPRVREDIGKIAVTRGPIVYCLEEADNGHDLHRVFVPENAAFQSRYEDNFFGGAVLLQSNGKRQEQTDWEPNSLYRPVSKTQYSDITLTWVPYYLWANRGRGEMSVWVRKLY